MLVRSSILLLRLLVDETGLGTVQCGAMNKENAVRRRIASTYNKPQDDFPSLRAYNDYLEEVENIVFNLLEGIDVQETEARIKAYQEENAEQIIAARAKKAERIASALREAKAGPVPVVSQTVAPVQESSGALGIQPELSTTGQYAPSVVAGNVYMQPKPMGPPPPASHNGDAHEDPYAQKLREAKGARAGGWTFELTRRRAFEEAFSSLFVN